MVAALGKRQRSTWRASNDNYDFINAVAKKQGVSLNVAFNLLLNELRDRRNSDSTVTAQPSTGNPAR